MSGAGHSFILGSLPLLLDDSLLVRPDADADARLWDVATGEQPGDDFPNFHEALPCSNQDEDSLRLVTAGETEVLIWNLDVDTGRLSAGSNPIADEWAKWGPTDTERYAVCPSYPLPEGGPSP